MIMVYNYGIVNVIHIYTRIIHTKIINIVVMINRWIYYGRYILMMMTYELICNGAMDYHDYNEI